MGSWLEDYPSPVTTEGRQAIDSEWRWPVAPSKVQRLAKELKPSLESLPAGDDEELGEAQQRRHGQRKVRGTAVVDNVRGGGGGGLDGDGERSGDDDGVEDEESASEDVLSGMALLPKEAHDSTVRGGEDSESEEGEYIIESILKSRRTKRGMQFLVKWDGYSSKQNTWEPEANVADTAALARFLTRNLM